MAEQTNVGVDKLCLESRKRLSMTGVQTVDGFSEQCLRLTVNGNKVTVCGQGIKISAFSKATGNLTADGEFREIRYGDKGKPFSKLFK
ncbi:MAG: hypothetical protein E7369_03200 [Clostridiales bacterium]|nr:hypothetical protein [Clostridiales bacterium]